MENYVESDKGIGVYDVVQQVQDTVSEMLNKEFEAIDATLKSNVKITIKIEEVKE